MKLFYFMLVVALIGALTLPFFMKGPDGKPLATVDQAMDDTFGGSVDAIAPSAPVEMYRWKNEHGIWEFGESPPPEAAAAKLSIDNSRITTMGSEWNVAPVIAETSEGSEAVAFQMPNTMADTYRAAPELMNAAKNAATLLNERQAGMDEDLEGLMQHLQSQKAH